MLSLYATCPELDKVHVSFPESISSSAYIPPSTRCPLLARVVRHGSDILSVPGWFPQYAMLQRHQRSAKVFAQQPVPKEETGEALGGWKVLVGGIGRQLCQHGVTREMLQDLQHAHGLTSGTSQ